LTGVSAEYAAGARARLEERRIAAFERLADLELALGRHEPLVEELTAWVAAYPLRERLAGQLMRALHAAGRQADALTAGRRYRESLAEQQGLDPGRAFLALEQTILRDQLAPPAKEPARAANFLPYERPGFHRACGRTGPDPPRPRDESLRHRRHGRGREDEIPNVTHFCVNVCGE